MYLEKLKLTRKYIMLIAIEDNILYISLLNLQDAKLVARY